MKTAIVSLEQLRIRAQVTVGGAVTDVPSVAVLFRQGVFKSDAEARGAFLLAEKQATCGLGQTPAAWLGLTAEEFSNFKRDGTLPKKK